MYQATSGKPTHTFFLTFYDRKTDISKLLYHAHAEFSLYIGARDVSEVWGTHRWTYSPSLVTVSSLKL